MVTPEQALKDIANDVADARERYHALKSQFDAKKAEFEKSVEFLAEELSYARSVLENAEEMARDQAVEIFWEIGEKKLPYGMGIRETAVLEYDTHDALAWAVKHQLALQLDVKTFEKLAKVLNLSFVRETNKVTATLPTDINKLRE